MQIQENNSKKVLVIGIDGATLDLIKPWADQGKLPTFKKLIQEGAWGELQTTIPPLTPSAWSSLICGKNPGKHGIYDFYCLDKKFNLSVCLSSDRSENTIWDYLSEAHKKCCVFQVPLTFPPQKINGVMVSGFETPSLESNFTYPPDFKKALLAKFPEYRLFENTKYAEDEKSRLAYLEDIFQMTEVQAKACQWMIESLSWDFFMAVFMGLDHVQHWYWKFMDKTHPSFNPNETTKLKYAILSIYQKMDKIINDLYQSAPKDTTLVIVSDHGFGPYIKNVYLNNWLRKKGYLKLKKTASVFLKKILNFFQIEPQSAIRLALKLGIGGKANKAVSFKGKKEIFSKISFTYQDIDWEKTSAYSFGYYGSIYITDKKNYKSVRKKLIRDLAEFSDPKTGEKIVDQIHTKEELYYGQCLEKMPDLIFKMKNYSLASSSMFAFPSHKIFSKPITLKSGEHRENAIFLAYGKDVKKGYLKNINIMDVTPTILNYMKIHSPSGMDGKIMPIFYEK